MDKDNYSHAGGQFSHAPYFNWNDGKLKFDTNDVSNANDNYGSASGFAPKFLPNQQKVSVRGYLLR